MIVNIYEEKIILGGGGGKTFLYIIPIAEIKINMGMYPCINFCKSNTRNKT